MRHHERSDLLAPLEPELEALLDRARRQDAKDPAYGDEPCERFLARMAPVTGAASRATGARSWPHLLGRPAFSIASVCLAGAIAAAAAARNWRAITPQDDATPTTAAKPAAVTSPPPSEAHEEPPVRAIHVDDLPSATPPPLRRPQPEANAPRPRDPSKAKGLAAEMRLLDAANAAALAKDHTTALRLVREHEQQFPNGQLVQQRERIFTTILVETGNHAEAQQRVRSFRARFPNGLLLPSIERSLETDTFTSP